MQWKIYSISQCNLDGQDKAYLHYFISYSNLKEFWVKIQQILGKKLIYLFLSH